MSIRGDDKQMVAITSFWATEDNLIRAGTVLPAKDPIVKRCKDFFAGAALMPTLDPEALRAAERSLLAKSLADGAG